MQRILYTTLLLFIFCTQSHADFWLQKTDFGGTNRADAAGFSINGKGYIGLGYTGPISYDWWEYDPISDTWSQKANFTGNGTIETASFAIGSKGYVLTYSGGINFWEYDPVANAWNAKAAFPPGQRQAAVAFTIDNMGYITTGLDTMSLSDLWEYDPASDAWS